MKHVRLARCVHVKAALSSPVTSKTVIISSECLEYLAGTLQRKVWIQSPWQLIHCTVLSECPRADWHYTFVITDSYSVGFVMTENTTYCSLYHNILMHWHNYQASFCSQKLLLHHVWFQNMLTTFLWWLWLHHLMFFFLKLSTVHFPALYLEATDVYCHVHETSLRC